MEKLLKESGKIVILSGEGTTGIYELYTGARTARALKSRLTKERSNGDRWAKAYIEYNNGIYLNIEEPSDLKHIPNNVITGLK